MEVPHDEKSLRLQKLVLCFYDADVEGAYLSEVASWRWPILLVIFAFDILVWFIRAAWQLHAILESASAPSALPEVGCHSTECPTSHTLASGIHQYAITVLPQVVNLFILHTMLLGLNSRSRRSGARAARQEEVLLSILVACAVTNLIVNITADNSSDYVYATFLIICCASFLKIRWWLSLLALSAPTVAAMTRQDPTILGDSAKEHIMVAWLAGGLMAWIAESYRRRTFAGQQQAKLAHAKELSQKSRHLHAQQELAAAREEAAQRALIVTREKAANEAKSEFMSLMCHEVRTPLNGCLASAEMLLETPLVDEQRELTNTIRISGSILLSTVSNFLDYFKVQAGKTLDIIRSPFHIMDLITDVHCIVEAMTGPSRKVHLLPPHADSSHVCLMGDPDRLKGVLLNLYSNAAKFTRSGFICVRVRKVLAHNVTPATLIHPEESYKVCLEALQRDPVAADAAAQRGAAGGEETWWERCVRGGGDPDWAAWRACSPSTVISGVLSSPARQASIENQRAAGKGLEGKASPGHGPRCGRHSVSIGSAPEGLPSSPQELLVVEVVDTGVGISELGRAALFAQFSQVSPTDVVQARQYSGTGLGLNICARQMQVLGGVIGAVSNPGHGSIFWFCIPVEAAPARPGKTSTLPHSSSWHSPTLSTALNASTSHGPRKAVKSASASHPTLDLASSMSFPPNATEHTLSTISPTDPVSTIPRGSHRSHFWSRGSFAISRSAEDDLVCSVPTARGTGSSATPCSSTRTSAATEASGQRTSSGSIVGRERHPFDAAAAANSHAHVQNSSLYKPYVPSNARKAREGGVGAASAFVRFADSAQTRRGSGNGHTASCEVTMPSDPDAKLCAPAVAASHPLPSCAACACCGRPCSTHPPFTGAAIASEGPSDAHAAPTYWGVVPMFARPPGNPPPDKPPPDKPIPDLPPRPSSDLHALTDPKPAACAALVQASPHTGARKPSGERLSLASLHTEPSATTSPRPAEAPQAPRDPLHSSFAQSPCNFSNPESSEAVRGCPDPWSDPRSGCSAGASPERQDADATGLHLEPALLVSEVAPRNSQGDTVTVTDSESCPWESHVPSGWALSQYGDSRLYHSTSSVRFSSSGRSDAASSAHGRLSARSIGDEDSAACEGEHGIQGVRVLLAEDNLINQMVAKKMLRALGAVVTVANDGKEAVASVAAMMAARASKVAAPAAIPAEEEAPCFDVVLMDMAMPQMDGVTAAAEIRRMHCDVPIVAMTANISERDQELCRAAGMDGFLSKPILKGRLGRAVRQVVAQGSLFDPSSGA